MIEHIDPDDVYDVEVFNRNFEALEEKIDSMPKSDAYVGKTGDTMTGPLVVPQLKIGLNAGTLPEGNNALTVGTYNKVAGDGAAVVGQASVAMFGSLYKVVGVSEDGRTFTMTSIPNELKAGDVLLAVLPPQYGTRYETVVSVDKSANQITVQNGTSLTEYFVYLLTRKYPVYAEGHYTVATGWAAHAEGYGTVAGHYAHAEGRGTRAVSSDSHAEGIWTIASDGGQHVGGKYNLPVKGAVVIGNGQSNKNRSNAYTLDWNGNGWFAGRVCVGEESAPKLAIRENELTTKAYVDKVSGGLKINAVFSNLPKDRAWTSAAYGNGIAVVVSSDATKADSIYFSQDRGGTWQAAEFDSIARSEVSINGVKQGGVWLVRYITDRFVAMHNTSQAYIYSFDGNVWHNVQDWCVYRDDVVPGPLGMFAFNREEKDYIGKVFKGPGQDGYNQSGLDTLYGRGYRCVLGGTRYLMLSSISCYAGTVAQSGNSPLSWQTVGRLPRSDDWIGMARNGEQGTRIVAIPEDGGKCIVSANDGDSWTEGGTLPVGTYRQIRYIDGLYIALGTVIALSSDGLSWRTAAAISGDWIDAWDDNEKLTAVGADGKVIYSLTSGETWVQSYTSVMQGNADMLETLASILGESFLATKNYVKTYVDNALAAALGGNEE